MRKTRRHNVVIAVVGAVAAHVALAGCLMANFHTYSRNVTGTPDAAIDVALVSVDTRSDAAGATALAPTPDVAPAARAAPVAAASGDTGAAPAVAPQPSAQGDAGKLEARENGRADAGAAATGAVEADSRAANAYEQVLIAHIRRFRGYPAVARRDHIEGQVMLRFDLDRSGHVLDAWVEQSSGRTSLDAEALATINRAQPLPPIPSDLPDRLDLSLPIDFHLESSSVGL